jgi:hypothetical protein
MALGVGRTFVSAMRWELGIGLLFTALLASYFVRHQTSQVLVSPLAPHSAAPSPPCAFAAPPSLVEPILPHLRRGYMESIAAGEAQGRVCYGGGPGELKFLSYIPSTFERMWEANANSSEWDADPCKVLREPQQVALLQRWLEIGVRYTRHPLPDVSAALADPEGVILSRLNFVDPSSGETTSFAIEPLAGLLRDPRSICLAQPHGITPDNPDVQSKDFLVLDPAALRLAHRALLLAPPRNTKIILFDLGSTRWMDSESPGMRWLHDTYAGAGLPFSDVYAWEPVASRYADAWAGMPLEVQASMHFYNMGVTGASESNQNPFTILKAVARPSDFVVFKMDIDQVRMVQVLLVEVPCPPPPLHCTHFTRTLTFTLASNHPMLLVSS